MRHTACLGVAVAAAVAVLFAAHPTDAMDYMVVEHTAQRVLGPAVMHASQCGTHVQAYPQHSYAAPSTTCSCGGSKADGTCTCGQKTAPTCSCGGSKADGTCTCGKKKACGCGRNNQSEMKDFAEEGIHTLFKVVRGGMKVVEHLADHISKKAQLKPCGCPLKKPCGCGAAPPCGCGCGCGVPVVPVVPVVACGCGCRR